MASNAEKIIKRYDRLKSLRGTWDSHWREIAELVYPRRDDFDTKRSPGEKRMTQVFNSTAIQANELLASGLVGLNINPATTWFRSNTEGLDEQAKRYLDNASKVMLEEINASSAGFYTAAYEYFLEFGAFGTAGMFIDENERKNGLVFQSRALSEIVVAENSDSMIDTIYRRFEWTVRQIKDRWPDVKGTTIEKAVKAEKWEQKFFIIHCIQPRKERDDKKKTADNMPIESTYVLQADRTLLEESGFEEIPLIVGRFYKSPMETYGRSPAMTALPDVKMLNEIMKTTIKAAQKSVDPPLIVPNDGFLNPLRTVPGGVNVFDGSINEAIGQLPSANPGIGLDFVTFLEDKIRSIFFVDQLQFAGGAQMTATEVLQRTEEKLRLMGPILGRVQSEFLGPVLDRVFGILFRQGRFGTPPESLPAKFDFEFTGQVAQAQRQQESNGFLRAVEVLGPLLQLKPETLTDNIEADKLLRDTMEMFGVSMDKLTPERKRDIIKDQREQIQQLQQQMALAEQAAQTDIVGNEAAEGG